MLMLLTSPMQHIQTLHYYVKITSLFQIFLQIVIGLNGTIHMTSHISKLKNKNKKQVNCKAQERDTHVMLH